MCKNSAKKKDEFFKLYIEVFDDDGNVRNCTRNKCIELIKAAESVNNEVGNYGDKTTGMMNTKMILNMRDAILNES